MPQFSIMWSKMTHYKVAVDKSISKNTIENWALRIHGPFKQATLNERSF